MSKKAQLIWSFNGKDGLKTAEHHLVHLKEFAQMEAVPILKSGINKTSPLSCDSTTLFHVDYRSSNLFASHRYYCDLSHPHGLW